MLGALPPHPTRGTPIFDESINRQSRLYYVVLDNPSLSVRRNPDHREDQSFSAFHAMGSLDGEHPIILLYKDPDETQAKTIKDSRQAVETHLFLKRLEDRGSG